MGAPAALHSVRRDPVLRRFTESARDRVLGTSTVAVHPTAGGAPLTLTAVRRGAQLAALLELLAGDPRAPREADAVRSALAWEPRQPALDLRGALAGFIGVLIAIVAVAAGRRMDRDGRGAEQAIGARFGPLNLADVVERELGAGGAGDVEKSEIGEQVALAGEAARDAPWSAAPKQPFPWQQDLWRHNTRVRSSACRS